MDDAQRDGLPEHPSMRVRARNTAVLAAGSAASGVLVYVFFALTTRHLGAAASAPVSVLWTYWSFAAAALTFPIQHWITRSVAAYGGQGQVRGGLVRLSLVMLAMSAAAGLLAWLVRGQLFHRDDLWFPALVAAMTFGSAAVGVSRGGLASRRLFGRLSVAIAGENALRCLGAVALIASHERSAVAFGLVLLGGQLVVLAWHSALRYSRGVERQPTGSPVAFLGGSAVGQLLGQTVLTGGPVLLSLLGGAPSDVTALFAGLAIFRTPYILALGVVPPLTIRLTALVVERNQAALRRIRWVVLAALVLASVPVAALAAWLGPDVLNLIFGKNVVLGRVPTMLVALGSLLAMANLVFTLMVMAQNRAVAVARAWLIGAAGVAPVLLLTSYSPLGRTCTAFLVAEVAAFVALVIEERSGTRKLEPVAAARD
jgi:O-antigen/teichoic acid export membrane protein